MQTVKTRKPDLLTGTPWKAILFFAMPMILGNLLQQLYTMVDAIVVSHYVGEEALAAIGASYALTSVFIAVALGLSIGSAVVLSQLYGAKNYAGTKAGINTLLINGLVAGIVLGGIGLVASSWILGVLNTPTTIMGSTKTYLDIYFWGLPFLFAYNGVSAILNALGDSKTPLILLLFSSVFNVILDIILVKYVGMGVAGVAIATLIAQGLSAIGGLLILLRKASVLTQSSGVYSWTTTKTMLAIAIPTTFQQCILFLGILLVQAVVNDFGFSVLAGYVAGARFESVCIIPLIALGNALATYTAQNVGAGQSHRVREGFQASCIIVVIISSLIFLILQVFTETLLIGFMGKIYTQSAFDTGLQYILFLSFFYLIMGLKSITDGALRGAGDVIVSTVANLINLAIRVLLSVGLAGIIGVSIVWIALPIGWTANLIISFVRYRRRIWQDIKPLASLD